MDNNILFSVLVMFFSFVFYINKTHNLCFNEYSNILNSFWDNIESERQKKNNIYFSDILSFLFKSGKKEDDDIETEHIGVKEDSNWRCADIEEYIRDNFVDFSLNVNKILSVFNVSSSWLSKNFRNSTGFTVLEYINYCRLEKSKELLATNMTISQVAYMSGFSSDVIFYRMFKKHEKMTPSRYREIIGVHRNTISDLKPQIRRKAMEKSKVELIPVPKHITGKKDITKIKYSLYTESEEWTPIIEVAKDAMGKIFFEAPTIEKGGIELFYDKTLEKEEYKISVGKMVMVYASDYQGACYAMASVIQLVNREEDDEFYIPSIYIKDAPDKEYRGFMIDLARCWHSKANVLSFIDLCYLYKIKYLQLHFCDDQSFTLPIESFPLLPTKGRSYSKEDIEEIKEYAKYRGIVLIPEVEFPGHCRQLNKIYPEVFSDRISDELYTRLKNTKRNDIIESEIELAFWDSVICPSREKSFKAITSIVDEVLEMFPDSPYIHVGGDEPSVGLWEHCPDCQKYMEEKGLDSPQALHADFTRRITDYVLSKGRTPIVWEGFTKEYSHMISKDVIVVAWEGTYQYANELLDSGFKIINASWKPLYIVPRYPRRCNIHDVLAWNVYNWENYTKFSENFLNPITVPATDKVLGSQLCSWESGFDCEIANVVEHLAAMSERVWSTKRYCDDNEFFSKYKKISVKAYNLIQQK